MTAETGSCYTPIGSGEKQRLARQSRGYAALDRKLINRALSQLDDQPLVVDLGCAQGYLSRQRFAEHPGIGPLIGIDRQPQALAQAAKRAPSSWSFHQLSIDDRFFAEQLMKIIERRNPDRRPLLVYCSFVLLHLPRPRQSLAELRSALPAGSFLLLHTVDDRLITADPDPENNLQRVLFPSVPDPTGGDRVHGGKLHQQLKSSGWKNIELFFNLQTTSSLSPTERQDLFAVSFAWRADGLRRALANGTASAEKRQELKELEAALAWLEKSLIRDENFSMNALITLSALAQS